MENSDQKKQEPPPLSAPYLPESGLPKPNRLGGLAYLLVAILASAAVGIEAATHMCAEVFFNPMPTKLHLAILATTPVILLATHFSLASGRAARHARWLLSANGFLTAVSFGYTVLFLPLMPAAFIAIILYGLGLLPYSPLFVLIASIAQNRRLFKQARAAGLSEIIWERWLAGFALACILLVGWQGYAVFLNQAMTLATTGSTAAAREAGVNRIRLLRGEHYVLAQCFQRYVTRPRGLWDWWEPVWGGRSSTQANRLLYFRLTGRDCREAELPFLYFAVIGNRNARRGGAAVRDGNKHISLRSAAYDISIAAAPDGGDAGPGAAYAELTLEFYNSGRSNEEARGQIIMPPGGVASRLTLWIDGEEREAAFGKKGVVRNAYNRVVQRNLDPALLTSAGPDRVLLQCFPIPPGGLMKVKVGFSLPLSPEQGQAWLRLPYLAERDFAIDLDQGVSVWAESGAPMTGKGTLRADPGEAAGREPRPALRQDVAFDDLPRVAVGLPLPQEPSAYRAELAGLAAVASLVREEARPERLIAVVLDVSMTNKSLWEPGGGEAVPWASVLDKVGEGCRVALFAGDVAVPALSAGEAKKKWPEALSRVSYAGADAQTGNLEKAWDACDGTPGAAVLWLHGAMPVDFSVTSGLEQRLRRRPPSQGGPTLFSLQIRPGVNRIEEALAGSQLVRLEPRFDEPAARRVAGLFADLAYPALARERYVFSLDGEADGSETRYAHVVRLAAAREIEQRLAGGETDEEAIEMALRMRLVTSATGSVVLENAAQYDQHSLDPRAASDAVPTIPEPEEWAMLAIAALLVGFTYLRKRLLALCRF